MNEQRNHLIETLWDYAVPALIISVTLLLLATPWPVLALLPTLGLLAALWLGRSKWMPYLFYGFVLLIPFGAFRGLGGEFSLLRLHWFFAVGLVLTVGLRLLLEKRLPDVLFQSRFWKAVFVFYLINLFTAIRSSYPVDSIQFIALLTIGYLLTALAMIVVDRKGFEVILPRIIVGSVFVGSLLVIIGWLFGIQLFIDPFSGRATGATDDPNNTALMIVFSLPLVIGLLLRARHIFIRLFMLVVCAGNVVAVIATFSRGGALALVFTLALMLWEYRRRINPRNLGLLLGISGLALVVFLVLSPESYTQRIKSIHTVQDTPLRRRFSYLIVTRDLAAERPLLGHGPGTFPPNYAKTDIGRELRKGGTDGRCKAHNTYAEVLVGSGLIGLFSFLAVLLCVNNSFLRAQRLFSAAGRPEAALLTSTYRISFLALLAYLMIYSDINHKYLLVSMALSQVALLLARRESEQETVNG